MGLRLWHVHEIRTQSKVISIYELAYCSPIVVILLLVLMAAGHHALPDTALMLSYSS